MENLAEKFKAVSTCFVTILRSNHKRLDELGDRVLALQAAVRGLDPTFDDTLAVKTEQINAAVAHLVLEREKQFAQLQQIIDSL
jgi:hypothetical protein